LKIFIKNTSFFSVTLDNIAAMNKSAITKSNRLDVAVDDHFCVCGKDLNYDNKGTEVVQLPTEDGKNITVLRSKAIMAEGSYFTEVII
jgi:hypothetical protein